MKRNYLWLFFAALSVIFTACSKDEIDPSIDIPAEFSTATLEVGELSKTITFTSNQSWIADIDKENNADDVSWLSLTPQDGDAGTGSLTLTAEPNYSRSERSAMVSIKVGELIKTAKIIQQAWITEIEDDTPTAKVASDGFFVVNEDWFGHDGSNGTVNYFQHSNGTYIPVYRMHRDANNGERLGVTTQFATIWGDNAYFSSKQGDRLVVADAKTLKKKAAYETVGGDGRAVVGIDDTKAYIGHSAGIAVMDIRDLQLTGQVSGVSVETGSMCLSANRVFTVSRSNLYIIDAQTDEVENAIPGTYYTLTRSKDGNVWVATSTGFVRYDPVTLETEDIAYPDGAAVASPWFAWNAGSLCAGTQNNVLYWTSSSRVVKYDIDTETANTALYTLGTSTHGSQLAFYGAGLRVDPLTDELILTVKHSGWGSSGAYNWIYKLDGSGNEITNFEYFGGTEESASYYEGGYFWFPAMPFFEDANKPQILVNQILLKAGEETVIDLNEKVVDYDNPMSSISKSVDFSGNVLVTYTLDGNDLTIQAGSEPGYSTCVLTVISNGVRIEKTIRIDVEM